MRPCFPAVLVTGPRQIGKAALLQLIGEDHDYITIDNPLVLQQAKEDPHLFLINHPGELILDEIQYAPELFPLMKIRVDEMGIQSLKTGREDACFSCLAFRPIT